MLPLETRLTHESFLAHPIFLRPQRPRVELASGQPPPPGRGSEAPDGVSRSLQNAARGWIRAWPNRWLPVQPERRPRPKVEGQTRPRDTGGQESASWAAPQAGSRRGSVRRFGVEVALGQDAECRRSCAERRAREAGMRWSRGPPPQPPLLAGAIWPHGETRADRSGLSGRRWPTTPTRAPSGPREHSSSLTPPEHAHHLRTAAQHRCAAVPSPHEISTASS